MTGQPLAEALDRPVTAALGARLAGRYRYGSVTVTVEYRDGGLTLGPPGEPARLVWQGGERFAVRPGFALGFYGSEVLVSASGGDLILHHPLGGTVVLQREER